MTTVEDGHIVLLCHGVDSPEQTQEVLLRIDVLFAMGRQEDVTARDKFQSAAGVC